MNKDLSDKSHDLIEEGKERLEDAKDAAGEKWDDLKEAVDDDDDDDEEMPAESGTV